MNSRNLPLSLVVCLLLGMPRLSLAADCSKEIRDIQGALRAFDAEGRQMGRGFLRDDVLGVTLDAFGKRMDGLDASSRLSPAWKGLREAKEAKDKLTSWDERLKRWGAGIAGYKNCMQMGVDCSVSDWLREHEILDKEFADWIKSMTDEGLEKVTERVEKAGELIKTFALKAGTTATGAMSSAVNCMADLAPQASSPVQSEAAQLSGPANAAGGGTRSRPSPGSGAAAPPVAPAPQPEPEPAPKKGAGRAGKTIAVVGVGAAAAGLYVAATTLKSLETSTATSTPSSGSGVSRYDGTYDFSFTHPAPGGQRTVVLNRFFLVRNGTISSTDRTVAGSVNSSGTVQFTGPCWDSSGGTATWSGSLLSTSPKTGEGPYVCQNRINGGTWRAYNGT